MPLFAEPVPRPLAGDRLAVKLPAQAHRKLADVDHLLDFAQGFLGDLADFAAHERGQVGLVTAKLFAKLPNELPAHWRRPPTPDLKRLDCCAGRGVDLG